MNIFKVDGKKNIGLLLISTLITEGVVFLNIFFGIKELEVYVSLKKPFFSPQAWVFPIAWALVFFFMALATYRIWLKRKSGKRIRKSLELYIIVLGFYVLWIILFFQCTLYGLAFIELLLSLIFVLLTSFEFFKIDKMACFMMIPYIIWLSFSGVICYVIWILNEAV